MAKKKTARDKRWSIDTKFANSRLTECNGYMDQIKTLIGKKGDFVNGKETLIGSVEFLNHEAQNGQTLMNAYNNFNKTTLKDLRRVLAKMDERLDHIDSIAK